MINQRAYPDVILGFGKAGQTIAALGCFVCSLLQGVLDRGYSFSVPEFNQLLKDKGCFDSRTLLNSSSIGFKIPEIFYEGRIEAWNDEKFIKYLSDPSYIILGEVDARGIGGSGQHFVYVKRADIENGKIKMTYIGDPWDGLDDQKITNRYNRYGNILSLRVFRVYLNKNQPPQDGQTMTYKGIDLNNTESVKVAIDMWDAVVKQGLYIKKTEHEEAQKELREELEARYSDRLTKIQELVKKEKEDAYNKGFDAGKKEGSPSTGQPILTEGKFEVVVKRL